jgi:lipopolysaccharide transport system ATP-binding protein
MYVRLAFAVAAHLDPEILLVDEVLAVGDAEFQKKCLGKMEDISLKEGRTVLFVSHQMDAIEKLTQRCLFLDNGKVHSVGDTSEVVDEYLHQNVEATDISQYRDRQGSQKARVVKMQVLREGQPAMGVKQGEPFQILIGIETRAEESLDISVVVENARQQALFCSQLSDKQHPSVVSGYAEFTVDVDKPVLRKGDYLISIALFKPDKSEFFDVVLHYPLISVEGMSAALEMPSDNRWGNLYFPLIWTRTGIS